MMKTLNSTAVGEVENYHWTALDTACKKDLGIEAFEVDALVDHLSKSDPERFLSFLKAPADQWKVHKKDSDFLQLIKHYELHVEKYLEQ